MCNTLNIQVLKHESAKTFRLTVQPCMNLKKNVLTKLLLTEILIH